MNGRISFTLGEESYTLHFGMKSAEVFAKKATKQVEKGQVIDGTLSMACIIFSGLVNFADIIEADYPTFEDAYLLAEKLIYEDVDGEKQRSIYNCWAESRPTKEIYERLGLPKPSIIEEKKSKKQKIGTK